MSPLDDALLVLSQYLLPTLSLTSLGNRGGFSGAKLWRCHSRDADFCLRCWPDATTTAQLACIHQRMIEASEVARLSFVPRVLRTRKNTSFVEHLGRLWDLTTWMPGDADFHRDPTRARLETACTSLALIHRAWEPLQTRQGNCPALRRRLDTWGRWKTLRDSGWSPPPGDHLARRAVEQLRRFGRVSANALELVSLRERPLQPCLCDIWHDHLLFEGDRLTGLIDYGEIKIDHVAVDLARMLGSLIEDDNERWHIGIEAYRRVRPLTEEEGELARLLDTSGIVLGISNWLRWLFHEGRVFEDVENARTRLTLLVERVERWGGGDPLLLV